jgi:hypothetical protein
MILSNNAAGFWVGYPKRSACQERNASSSHLEAKQLIYDKLK